ncbi:indole-3-glycerol phosphate synthase TrpC [bacterium]|nr:indole-3-glycerol phosphate synthase TrpC [bacterium]
MNILDQIIDSKKTYLAQRRALYPIALLEKSIYFSSPTVSLSSYLQRPDKVGVIAEIKRSSPSAGVINPYINVEELAIGYMQAGASALSVLTDTPFFNGKDEDLTTARKYNFCPILRKDFIIDEYQIVEARSLGADAILLIATVLSAADTQRLAKFARALNLEVILEVHDACEIESHLTDNVSVIGINNRDLRTNQTKLETSFELISLLPQDSIRISESGIKTPADFLKLKAAGFHGALIGEVFMKEPIPQQACKTFIAAVLEAGKNEN